MTLIVKKVLGVAVVLICIYACKQKTRTNIAIKDTHKIVKTALTDSTEYLDWNTAKINGSVALLASKDELYQALGKPDSIINPNMDDICTSYFNKPFKYVYVRGSQFELYGDTVVVSTLNFKGTNLKVVFGNLSLNANSTLISLSKIFPKAVKNQSEMVINKNEKVMTVTLNTDNKPTDDAWILMFENGKLVRIDYWIPC